MKNNFLKNYAYSLILVSFILLGSFLGMTLGAKAVTFKPLGDIFLNLLFTIVVPLVFFSVSSAVANMKSLDRLGKILFWLVVIAVITGVIAACMMIIGVKIYPPGAGVNIDTSHIVRAEGSRVSDQLMRAFTVTDFVDLLSKKNMLVLIFLSLLVGLAASTSGEKGRPFVHFLISGNEVMCKLIKYIMLYAPIGLGAYFAYLVGKFGAELMGTYFRVIVLYYPVAILYFFLGHTFYVYLAGGSYAVKRFWENIIPASLTAWGTGSSIATIPVNLEAAERIGIPQDIREVVIPVGATMHKGGSCIAAVLKIAFLFGIFNMDFTGIGTILTAVLVAIFSGVVMGGIPGGGFLGELLIVTLYGFPVEALPMISMIGTIVDPPATMVNSVGDNVAAMLVSRILGGKKWMHK